MGDRRNDPLRVDFDRQIKLEFHGSTVTSDAGLLAYRELDDALGLTTTAAYGLHDSRTGQNTQHGLEALLRQSIYSRLAGYEDVNAAEWLFRLPAIGSPFLVRRCSLTGGPVFGVHYRGSDGSSLPRTRVLPETPGRGPSRTRSMN
jgi:hypothetical protein